MNEAARRERCKQLGADISKKLDEIAALFSEPVAVTVVVRNTAKPDGSRDTILSTERNPIDGLRAGFSLLQDHTAEIYRA